MTGRQRPRRPRPRALRCPDELPRHQWTSMPRHQLPLQGKLQDSSGLRVLRHLLCPSDQDAGRYSAVQRGLRLSKDVRASVHRGSSDWPHRNRHDDHSGEQTTLRRIPHRQSGLSRRVCDADWPPDVGERRRQGDRRQVEEGPWHHWEWRAPVPRHRHPEDHSGLPILYGPEHTDPQHSEVQLLLPQ